ncbi:hypothetical protein Leryth_023648 [Lithospermum erythrorhizon]|uniref:Epidermal patterning factor-like protein n=1 Tax=Lithospermum erythrorhizon TaxID=34254 RepID=A0AAV3R3K5_LITER|nr:hypothetical protein Leryth_023648 [Lithospermum erythrorhizon]
MPLPSSYFPYDLRLSLTVVCICSLILSPSISDGQPSSRYNDNLQRKKMVLGSRPPACVGKCMNCKPCQATLVIPPHGKRSNRDNKQSHFSHRGGREDDDTYYLLSWKCRCGNKLFQP